MNLITQIAIGLVLGLIFAFIMPEQAKHFEILGAIFTGFLRSLAPILVFTLSISSICRFEKKSSKQMKPIFILYFISTFSAAVSAVIISAIFPSSIPLDTNSAELSTIPEKNIYGVFEGLFLNITQNPFEAISSGNYIGLLFWGTILGFAFKHASDATKTIINDFSAAINYFVSLIIRFAPIGIFGIVSSTFATIGFEKLTNFAHLILVLVGCMFFVIFVINAFLVFLITKKNPYPLIFFALKESAVPAFFTRSSAANIPINLAICKKLKLPENIYSVSIPLGANINLAGAAVTITILTLAAVNTLGIKTDLSTNILLSFVATICACGASGVAGGSLLLIPVACGLFGIPAEIAINVVAIGFAISIIQDSVETALNSSSDVLYTIAVCSSEKFKNKVTNENN